jgi:hypothetical protein
MHMRTIPDGDSSIEGFYSIALLSLNVIQPNVQVQMKKW